MSSSHSPVHLFCPNSLPTYLRHVLLIAFSVVQYQHGMKAAYRIPHSFSLSHTQNILWRTTLFIDQTQHQTEKEKPGESKSQDL
jgi:hypothetical protein